MSEKQGTIVQVMGPVVDVAFDGGALPELKEALEVELDGRREVMEVAQHVGGDTVRCIMLSPSEGLGRGMAVTATGAPISVPVGEGVLGRMFNVLGDAIDEKGPVQTSEKWSIHRQPPAFENQRPVVDIFETGILRQRRKDRPVRRRRRGQDGAHPGADPQHRHRARRLLHLHRRGGAHPRGQRPLAGDDRVGGH